MYLSIARFAVPLVTALIISFNGLSTAHAADEVNVYSYRKPQLIEPMFDRFSDNTGIKVNAVFAEKGMLERLKSEGRNSPADLIFTVDIGRLTDFKEAGLTQPADSDRHPTKASLPRPATLRITGLV